MRKLILLAVFALSLIQVTAQVTAVQPSGAGTAISPYLISSIDELYWITQNSSSWNKQFLQTADIDAANLANFPQIGSSTTPFTGVYNGGFRTISNLKQSGALTMFGMFGYSQGEIRNLGLININYTSTSNISTAGAIASWQVNVASKTSLISQCYATGNMTATFTFSVGGLVGYMNAQHVGNTSTPVVMEYSYSRVSMNCLASSPNIGGLCGITSSQTSLQSIQIRNSYSRSKIRTTASSITHGGLIAYSNNAGHFYTNNYVSTKFYIGNNKNKSVFWAWLGGSGLGVTFQNNYYNDDTLKFNIGTGSLSNQGGSALTNAQMKVPANFANWDFTNVWAQNSTVNDGYPYLSVTQQSQLPSITIAGSMTAFSACTGSASAAQSFTVSGSNLSGSITVTAPTGFEVSNASSSGFGPSVTLSATNNVVASTTLYVRMASTATGTPSGNIQATSTSATTKNLAVSGTVRALPTISGGSSVAVGNTLALTGSASAAVANAWATSNASVASISGTTGTSVTVSGVASGSATITYTNSNGCVATQAVSVVVPTISTSGSLSAFTTCLGVASTAQSFSVSGIDLTADISVAAPTGFEISLTSGSGYATSLTLSQTAGAVASTTVYVRVASTATGTPSGNVTLSSSFASNKTVAVSATLQTGIVTSIGGTASVCAGQTTTLTHSSAGGTWSSSNTAVATVNSSTGVVTGVALGSTTITYVYTSTNGCSATATETVTVNDIPVASATGNTRCGAGVVSLSASATNGGTLSWFDVVTGGSALSSGSTYQPTVSAGISTYYAEATNVCGASATRASAIVTAYALPTAPTVTNGQRCGAGTVALSASVGANTTLRWYASGGTTLLASSSSFTTPSLSATTSYDVEALSSNGCVSATKTVATATIVTTPTWSGTGVWTTPSNWTCGSNTVPTGAEDITVAFGTLTLDADVVLSGNKTLSVASGATLVVAPTWALTIESGSTLSNEGTVVVDANSSDYGQLVLKGTYTKVGSGTVTVKRAYDVTGANLNQKWVQMSSPVDANYSSLGSVANNNLLYWDASISNWVSALSTGSAFDGTKGFTAYYGTNGISTTTNGVISLSGSPFTSVATPTLHNHNGLGQGAFNSFAGSAKSGWNLIGNPFTCNLDFSAFSLANVNASFYRWDAYKGGPGVGGYQAHSAASANPQSTSAVIAPMSAVWVRANGNGSPSLHNGNLNVSSHGHRGPKSFKTQPDKFLLTVVDIAQPLIADDLSVAMVPGASDAFEGSWDAWELLNSVQMPNLYANFNSEWTTAKAVDFDLNSTVVKVIPVSVKASVEMRPYRIHLDESWAQPGYTVYLKDKLLVNTHKLSTSDYVFAYTSAMEDRFELILTNAKTGALGLEEASRGALAAWVSGSELWITGLESGAQEIDVVGMDGRVVASTNLRAEEGQPATTVLPELPAGLYTVRVRANGLERGVRFMVQK